MDPTLQTLGPAHSPRGPLGLGSRGWALQVEIDCSACGGLGEVTSGIHLGQEGEEKCLSSVGGDQKIPPTLTSSLGLDGCLRLCHPLHVPAPHPPVPPFLSATHPILPLFSGSS